MIQSIRHVICSIGYRTHYSKLQCCYFYDWRSRTDTIFAPATTIEPKKGSPLGIIRISGSKTSHVIEKLTHLTIENTETTSHYNNPTKTLKPRYATLAKIFDPQSKDIIDVALVLWFAKPNSYTGEDTCELHVHGSRAIMTKLLHELGKLNGLRPAEPGEFTRRAVENKKLSLFQAESLSELIASRTDYQRKLALQGLYGSTRQKYDTWINELVTVLAHLEASIDFGEDELIGEQQVVGECILKLQKLSKDINRFIEVSGRCRDLIQCGPRIVILGRPNAGKSTLMNMLCRQDKSIVSDLSGTTRDIIEHTIELDGHSLTLCDTAGLRDSTKVARDALKSDAAAVAAGQEIGRGDLIEQHDSIEREGIKRAFDAAKKSNLVLYLIDGLHLMTQDEFECTKKELIDNFAILLEQNNRERENQIKSIHLVINKMDMWRENAAGDVIEKLECFIKDTPQFADKLVQVSQMSCKTQENFDSLIKKISLDLNRLISSAAACEDNLKGNNNNNNGINLDVHDLDYVNERHLSLLRSSSSHINRARRLNMGTIDEMAQHVRESVSYLSRIVGNVSNEQVIDVIFRDFCIGK